MRYDVDNHMLLCIHSKVMRYLRLSHITYLQSPIHPLHIHFQQTITTIPCNKGNYHDPTSISKEPHQQNAVYQVSFAEIYCPPRGLPRRGPVLITVLLEADRYSHQSTLY